MPAWLITLWHVVPVSRDVAQRYGGENSTASSDIVGKSQHHGTAWGAPHVEGPCKSPALLAEGTWFQGA